MTDLHILAARAALGFALAAALPAASAVPASAQPTAAVVPPDGEACAPAMARWQSAEAQHSAMSPADLDAYNAIQNEIDRGAHLCEAGQDAEAKAVMEASKRPAPALH